MAERMKSRTRTAPAAPDMELDIVSRGRRGPGRRAGPQPTEVKPSGGTAGRKHDLAVKVSGGAQDTARNWLGSPGSPIVDSLPGLGSSAGSGGAGSSGGSGAWLQLDPRQVEQVRRTVNRAPEVVIKVSGGGRDCEGVKGHLTYLGREGKLALETDDGLTLQGRDVADHLAADWQLDLGPSQYQPAPGDGEKDKRAKLVHNLVLSMPEGTPAESVLEAVRGFAQANFAQQHRYAMVLHTDQDHPHVHLVVKCEHETQLDRRLYIRKDTLRQWREQFAELMREQGVEANATPRQVRGQEKDTRKSPVHHRLLAVQAARNMADAPSGDAATGPVPGSTFVQRKVLEVARQLQAGQLMPDDGKATLTATRRQVEADWAATADALRRQGHDALAAQVEQFIRAMAPVRTDRERIAAGLLEALQARRARQYDAAAPDRSPERSR